MRSTACSCASTRRKISALSPNVNTVRFGCDFSDILEVSKAPQRKEKRDRSARESNTIANQDVNRRTLSRPRGYQRRAEASDFSQTQKRSLGRSFIFSVVCFSCFNQIHHNMTFIAVRSDMFCWFNDVRLGTGSPLGAWLNSSSPQWLSQRRVSVTFGCMTLAEVTVGSGTTRDIGKKISFC